jgi:photosystem II stability/assembly factor-like uncharacterized protein
MMAAMRRVAVVALTLALMSIMGPQAAAQGDDDQGGGPDWVDTPLTSSTSRLFTPSSGALLAATSDGLMRSDDAGDSWYPIDTQGQRVVYVDPTNQDVIYTTSNTDPLLQSTDGGANWTKLLSGPPYQGKQLAAFAVSAADTNVMYAGLVQGSISDQFWFYGSRDGGSTWTQLSHAQYSLCGWGVAILMPHPTDASRLFFSGGCHAGRDFSETLQQSVDYGQSFTQIYVDRDTTADAPSGFPRALVGGTGVEPTRWYLLVNRDQRFGGSFILRSDDDGGSWNPILDFVGGGTFDQDKTNFSVTMSALAADPNNPDTIYVARAGAYSGYPAPTPVTSGVTVSNDGGQSWNDIGNQQEGMLNDLKLGIDGKYLFLATDHGVTRMSLQ